MTFFSRPGWRAIAGLVASAVLLGFYWRGSHAYLLGFVALVPWLLALNATAGIGGSVRSGLLMSIAFAAAVLAWFGIAIAHYIGIGAGFGLAALLVAAPLLQPQFIAFAVARHLAGRHHGAILRALAGASAWVATEWLVPKLFSDTFGHGLYPSLQMRQIADVGGGAGMTFLLILINEGVVAAIARRRDGVRAIAAPIAISASLIVAMAGYGIVRLSMLDAAREAEAKPLRIGMVQSNIVDYERLRRELGAYAVVREVLDTHYAMSREAVDAHRVDALLWSETVYPTTFAHPKSEGGGELDREILAFVAAAGVPLVFGTYDLDANGEYNAAAFVEPAGTLGFYRKSRPFPLTEYVPPWLDGPNLRHLLPWAGGWQPGSGARVFPVRLADGREIPVLPLICLDDTDSGLAIEGARQGAQAIVGMSNDSWFTEHTVGAQLHLASAAFRSIETRMPQVRVTSNGISAAIDAEGSVLARTAMDERRLLIGEIAVGPPAPTLMVAWGDWVGLAGLALLLLMAAAGALRGAANRRVRRGAAVSAGADAPYRADLVVLGPAWRIAAGLLRVFARGSLLVMGATMLLPSDTPPNTLSQIWMFAALFLAPEAAAWSILRAFAASARIEGETLVLEQHERRIEIRANDIAAAALWKLPLPNSGLSLTLASGRRWSHGIVSTDPASLIDALVRAGAPPSLTAALTSHAGVYARARAAIARRFFDRAFAKFVLFPLLPALPAFRLHQHIAFGGTFGEYYTYGLKAYLLALLVWWAKWAIGLLCFAAALRVAIETGSLLSIALRPAKAVEIRKHLERLGRLLFYLGIPAWLLIRLWPW